MLSPFKQILNINCGHYIKSIPLHNSFGNVFPVLQDDLLSKICNIGTSDLVLDIGGGSNPFVRANIVTEPHLTKSMHRSGLPVNPYIKYIECFAESLPFDSNSFDFAIARQVFEHVDNPSLACKEMMRVAKRGFIETPQKNYELLFGPNPSHNWFVHIKDNTLVFERRMFIRHPLRHLGLGTVPSSPEGQVLLHWELKNLTNVQFYWEQSFPYEVKDNPSGFNYNNPDHAAEAHLDVAICGLLQGGYYLPHRENDARQAILLKPDWALAHNTLGIILWKQHKLAEALSEFKLAAALDDNLDYQFNAQLQDPHAEPRLVDFNYTLPMDEAFYSRYSSSCAFHTINLLTAPHCSL